MSHLRPNLNKYIHTSQNSIGSSSNVNRNQNANKYPENSEKQLAHYKLPIMNGVTTSRNLNSIEVFKSGESTPVKNKLSISKEMPISLNRFDEINQKLTLSYGQTETLRTPSNIRIRGPGGKYKSKQSVEYRSREELMISSQRKNIIQASQRLKTLEEYEQNKLKDIKNEIQRLEDKHTIEEVEKKKKINLIAERRKKLNEDRKKLEIKRQKRLAIKESDSSWNYFNY